MGNPVIYTNFELRLIAYLSQQRSASVLFLSRNQLRGRRNLSPRVPEQNTAYVPVSQIVNDALAERLLPVFDNIEAGIEFAHRLIAQIEQVGVKVRLVAVYVG